MGVVKKLVPKKLILLYHYVVAIWATIRYGFASKKMIVIGVTGTKGKTSVINFLWSVLMEGGWKTGIITTANIRIGDKEWLNKYHMTMPGANIIQKYMAEMVKEGCRVCIVETTSEGLKQYRHIGIEYDIAIFTNLTPEHLESHENSFEKYKRMKGKLFEALRNSNKRIGGKRVEKVIVANFDSEYANYYLKFWADKKLTFGTKKGADYVAEKMEETEGGVKFEVNKRDYKLNILGEFNVYNALPAIVVGEYLGIDNKKMAKGLENLRVIPGRMEKIEEGQNFTVIVDYAHEKESLTKVLQVARARVKKEGKVIILLGAEGGGRDKAKRPIMGEIAGRSADYVVVSNVDPYKDSPGQILEDIAKASEKIGKVRGKNLFVIEDRRTGIEKALKLAKKGDIVLITGKGAEQSIVIGGKRFDWDDRVVVREELKKCIYPVDL